MPVVTLRIEPPARPIAAARLAATVLLLLAAGCFPGYDLGRFEGGRSDADDARDGSVDADADGDADADADGDADIEDAADADSDADADADADADVDVEVGDAGDADDEGGDDGRPVCGNGAVEPGEECDGATPESCTTSCSSAGTRSCVSCLWGSCEVPISETCNGADDDCDGVTDEGLWAPEPSPHRVTISASLTSTDPEIAWTVSETEYGVVWTDDAGPSAESGIYFTRLSAVGTKLVSDVLVSTETGIPPPGYRHVEPTLAWTGTEWGFAWNDGRSADIFFRRVSGAGVRIGTEVQITSASNVSQNPSLVWTSGEYGVAWNDGRDSNLEIYFTRISDTGTKPIGDVRLTNTPSATSARPSLAWTGSEFGAAWYEASAGDPGNVYFTRVTAAGTEVPGPSGRSSSHPSCSSSRGSCETTRSPAGTASPGSTTAPAAATTSTSPASTRTAS